MVGHHECVAIGVDGERPRHERRHSVAPGLLIATSAAAARAVERESHFAPKLARACERAATEVSSMRERWIIGPMRTGAEDTGANSDALLMTPNE